MQARAGLPADWSFPIDINYCVIPSAVDVVVVVPRHPSEKRQHEQSEIACKGNISENTSPDDVEI